MKKLLLFSLLLGVQKTSLAVDFNAQAIPSANVISLQDYLAGFTNGVIARKFTVQTILSLVSNTPAGTNAIVAAGNYIIVQTNASGLTVKYTINLDTSITNGLATIAYVNAATNGFVTSSVTNGLATITYANSVTNGYPWGVLYDPAGAAQAATNGYPWGVLYDAAGTASAATNALSTALLAVITAATNALNTALRADLVPQTRTITIDGTSQDLSANRTYSSAPNIASIVTPGIIVTNGAQGYTMVFSNAVNFKDAVGNQMSVSNGVIGSVNAITNSGSIQSSTLKLSGTATVGSVNASGNYQISGVVMMTIPSGSILSLGSGATSVLLTKPVNAQGASVVSITNSVGSYRSNAIGPTSITAPASTVNWTNPINANIQVYIDATGVTGTAVKKNGTQIFSSLVGDVTLELQPQEYFSLTYSIGTPSVTWSPF